MRRPDFRLLLVEDSASLQRSLGAGLRQTGYTVDQAMDGHVATRFIDSGGYDIIVLDLMLPGIDGHTLLARLRQAGDHTRVLVLSARNAVDDRIRILDAGADDFLVKPFDFDELLLRLRALLRSDRGRGRLTPDRGHQIVDRLVKDAATATATRKRIV